jgi:catechol 2,3-dioxygenase-like lactoylglutathione lyase family enzyme
MTALARLGAVSIDAADPAALAAFYQQLLDLEVLFESPTFIALKGAGVLLTFQQVKDHLPPDWPGTAIPKQLHLELAVTDLDAAEEQAIEYGAIKAPEQPAPDRWRVLLDPAGHPFCLTNLIPEV